MYTERLRYDDLTDKEFKEIQGEYFGSLIKMPFGEKSCLLKYFGFSFFHDAKILNLSLRPDKKMLKIDISSQNIVEDINDFRIKKGLPKIQEKFFWENPISYQVSFSKINEFSFSIDLSHDLIIMDTEIEAFEKGKGFKISIQMEDRKLLLFYCSGASIKVDTGLIAEYTNGLHKIPYCENCRAKLLTKRKLVSLIELYSI